MFTQLSVPAGFKKCLTIQLETFPPASGSFIFLPTAQRNVEPIDLAVEIQRLTGTNYRLTSWGLCNVSPSGVEARSKTNLIKNGTSLSTFNLHIGHSVDALIQGELQGQSSCGSVVEHCVSSAKRLWVQFPGNILTNKRSNLNRFG